MLWKKFIFQKILDEKDKVRKRLVFEERLTLQLRLTQLKRNQGSIPGIVFEKKQEISEFINKLPFNLTNAQLRVFSEIEKDMTSPKQMNRLVQGDVGSGKTIVAVMAILLAVLNGNQAVFMVPTEILAEQHYQSVQPMLEVYNENRCYNRQRVKKGKRAH